ncbi:hypothetical protein BVIET440_10338 [Burkholderia vietnamiensis]
MTAAESHECVRSGTASGGLATALTKEHHETWHSPGLPRSRLPRHVERLQVHHALDDPDA